ncbi:Predicted transcriptional regulator [gamma proteobacterium HdN1]|nr:Predicted transcriptional regulator [gamma proteobacterium HdN1]
MIKASELKRFDITEHLDSEEAIAEYLTIVLEEDDPALLAAAVGDIAKARGMTQVAKDAGLSRESLYASLGGSTIPRFDTLHKVMNALGIKLVAVPKTPTDLASHR